jgi:hypothetical protein
MMHERLKSKKVKGVPRDAMFAKKRVKLRGLRMLEDNGTIPDAEPPQDLLDVSVADTQLILCECCWRYDLYL